MFDFLKSSKHSGIEDIILRLNMNMSNNYKDAAQSNFREFEAYFYELKASGKLNLKQEAKKNWDLNSKGNSSLYWRLFLYFQP